MHRLLRVLRTMRDLQELHLVNLLELENQMDLLCESIKNHRLLKVLDVRQENMRKREVSALVPLLSTNFFIERIDISKAIVSKVNIMHLWLALHKNISVVELIFCRINFFALEEIKALDAEIVINQVIQKQIMPRVDLNNIRKISLRELPIDA
jgi:hypothetical protein